MIDWVVPVREGLRLLLCSDGLTKELDAEAISAYLAAGRSAEETALALVDAALEGGGRDNITTIVIDVLESSGVGEFENTIASLEQVGIRAAGDDAGKPCHVAGRAGVVSNADFAGEEGISRCPAIEIPRLGLDKPGAKPARR